MAQMSEATRSVWKRYGTALLGVVLAIGLRYALDPVLGDTRPFVTLYLATAVTSLIAGLGPGLLSIALSTVMGTFLFIPTRMTFLVKEQQEAISLIIFIVISTIVAILGESLRNAKKKAVEGQEALRREMEARQLVESVLRNHEARFRALIEHNSDVVSMIAADGAIAYISPSIYRVLGYSAEELTGESGFREVHPDDREGTAAALAKAVSQPGVPVVYSLRAHHKNGSWRWVENVGTSFLGDPSIAAVVVNSRDVTESRAMENQIRQAESRFRTFMDNSPAISFVKDEQGRYVWGNLAWATKLGRPIGELIGQDDFALWPEPTAQIFRKNDRDALDSGRTLEVVEEVGDSRYMSLKFPLEHEGGRYVGGITLDVTERLAAEAALRRSETLLHALADSMPEIVWAAQPNGHVDYFNRRWFDYTGFTEDESYSPGWAKILHPDDFSRCLDVWNASVKSGMPYQIEYRFEDRKNGGYRWHLGRALPVRDDEGRIVRWYGNCTDIDDQKKALQAAESANQAKTRFLAVLSHELRTPLTPVLLSVSSLLEDQSIGPEFRGVLEMARRNIALESRLIDDLLDVTQITRGKLTLRNETVDAHALILQAVEVCREDLKSSGLILRLALDAPSTTISADPARFQQIIWNLVKNSAKFTPSGGRISVRSANEEGGAGTLLVVEVSDTGIGIDPEFLPRMFEPFEQAEDSPWTRRYGGLGLGLAISLAVVEGLGGTLCARSDGKGRGATIRITLPLAEAASVVPATPPVRPPLTLAVNGLRILLVEDDPSTLSLLSRLLTRSRHAVTTADSVASAMAASSGGADLFDLIISDIGLPDGNGVDLMRDLQSRRVVPAIALTGYGQDEDIRRYRSAGFRAHLTKPIDFHALEETIKRVVESAV